MAWSYINPAANNKDKVRFLVGDTDSTDQLVTDEEITWALEGSTIYSAASTIAQSISAKFSRLADKDVDDLSIKYSQIAKAYMDKAISLKKLDNEKSFASPYLGGISKAEKDVASENNDLVQPEFKKDMFDNISVVDDRGC